MAAPAGQRVSDSTASASIAVPSYIPVHVDTSSPFASKGQLTGIPRKVKDAVADLHNCVSKWDSKKQHGYDILSKMANIKAATAQVATANGCNDVNRLPESLLPLCDDIHKVCIYLEKQVKKMAAIAQSLRALAALCRHRRGATATSKAAEGHWLPQSSPTAAASEAATAQLRGSGGWSIDRFAAAFSHLESCYSSEALAKRNVAENLAHVGGGGDERDVAMLLLSCWLHEPLVDDACGMLLEAMLVETGHRQLPAHAAS